MAVMPQAAPQNAAPVKLPACTVDLNNFPKHYSLNKKMRGQAVIHREMTEYQSYLRAPVETTREGASSAVRTVENLVNHVFLYLGFCCLHFGVEIFRLALFLDLHKYAAYISFLQRRNLPEPAAGQRPKGVWLPRAQSRCGEEGYHRCHGHMAKQGQQAAGQGDASNKAGHRAAGGSRELDAC